MSPPSPATSSNRPRGERGAVSIELVILLPALFAVMFIGMQAALYHHARAVAIAAAQEGARAAGAENGRSSDGEAAAAAFLDDAGEGALGQSSVAVDRTATTATVTVEGFSLSVIPGWTPAIRQSATVPVERLTSP